MRGGFLGLVVAVATVTQGADTLACGGCFAPPSVITVVTDHRMVFSMSSTQTTLWDQFAFTGRATEFSWILPIRYSPTVRVALADERFLTYLHNVSVPTLTPPSVPFPSCGGFPSADAGAAFDASASDGGVVVFREETVGPYAVAILGGSDPTAVRDWLSANGFTVPTAVAPVLDYYVSLRMDFVALRLRAGATTGMITPVRVTVPGATPSLPLRMIAAGIADRVGLSLMVLAPSRIEAMNFPNGEIHESDLVYDFASRTDPARDFLDAFNRLNAANGQRLWLTESSTPMFRSTLDLFAVAAPPLTRDGGVPGTDDSGVEVLPNLREDVSVAFEGLGSSARLTRLRADMPAAMLDRDLLLAASDNTAERNQSYTYGVVRNRPLPPVCPDSGPSIDAPPPEDVTVVVDAPNDVGTRVDVRDAAVADAADDIVMPVADASSTDAGSTDAGSAAPTPAASSGGIQCAARVGDVPYNGASVAVLFGVAVAVRRRRRARG